MGLLEFFAGEAPRGKESYMLRTARMISTLAAAGAAIAITLSSAASAFAMTDQRSVADAGASASSRAAAAAPACWWDGGKGHWYCNNRRHAPLYDGDRIVGYVDTTTSWFRCRRDGGRNHGGPHPTRWELTRADTAGNPWGWMSDNDISSETDPLPTC